MDINGKLDKPIILKIGDVFACSLDDGRKRFVQYIANDETQLNSSVIRGFRRIYAVDESIDLFDIVKDERDFYCHYFLGNVIKTLGWRKVGNVGDLGNSDLLFRDSADYGSTPGKQVAISSKWYIWRVNEPMQFVGNLLGKNRHAEIE